MSRYRTCCEEDGGDIRVEGKCFPPSTNICQSMPGTEVSDRPYLSTLFNPLLSAFRGRVTCVSHQKGHKV